MTVAYVHLAATALMAGVILFVQVVHYPLMARVGSGYGDYQRDHMRRTAVVVMPLMLAELGTAVWLAARPFRPELAATAWLGVGLLAVIWASTALLQAPAHQRLTHGLDPAIHRRLVRTNWIRTVAWAARVPIAFALA